MYIIREGDSVSSLGYTRVTSVQGTNRKVYTAKRWKSLTLLWSRISYLPNPSARCLTKAEEPSLLYYLPIAGGRIIGFIPFPRVLVLCEMQSVSSRIWTRVAVFISYGDNDYTTGTSPGLEYKGWRSHVLAAEERTTTSVLLTTFNTVWS